MNYGRLSQSTKSKCVVRRIVLDSGGYERSGYHRGRYWGIGPKLWEVESVEGSDEGDSEHVRAVSKEAAKRHFPNAKWGR